MADADRTQLVIAVRRKQPIFLRVVMPYVTSGRPVARFRGPAGAWIVHGWHAGAHEIVFPLGHDMDSLSRVLMLLSGGMLDLDSPDGNLPIFTLSASGPDGQRWFSCAKRLVI